MRKQRTKLALFSDFQVGALAYVIRRPHSLSRPTGKAFYPAVRITRESSTVVSARQVVDVLHSEDSTIPQDRTAFQRHARARPNKAVMILDLNSSVTANDSSV